MSRLFDAHDYLQSMDKTRFSLEYFGQSFEESHIYYNKGGLDDETI